MESVEYFYFFFSIRRRHTRFKCDWSSDVCSSDLQKIPARRAALILSPAGILNYAVPVYGCRSIVHQSGLSTISDEWLLTSGLGNVPVSPASQYSQVPICGDAGSVACSAPLLPASVAGRVPVSSANQYSQVPNCGDAGTIASLTGLSSPLDLCIIPPACEIPANTTRKAPSNTTPIKEVLFMLFPPWLTLAVNDSASHLRL